MLIRRNEQIINMKHHQHSKAATTQTQHSLNKKCNKNYNRATTRKLRIFLIRSVIETTTKQENKLNTILIRKVIETTTEQQQGNSVFS